MTLNEHYKAIRADMLHPASRCFQWAKDRVLADKLDSEIDYEFTLEEEYESPEDCNCDTEAAKYVREQIESGNEFAWFSAKITVKHLGQKSEQYLGACSYRDFQDFKYGGYFTDMIQEGVQECESEAFSDQSGEH